MREGQSNALKFVFGNVGALAAFLLIEVLLGPLPLWLNLFVLVASVGLTNFAIIGRHHKKVGSAFPALRWRGYFLAALVIVFVAERWSARRLATSFELGKAAFERGAYHDSEESLRTSAVFASIRFDGKAVCRIKGYLGNAYLEQGKYREAEATLKAAISSCAGYGDPSDVIADYASLGTTYEYSGDNREAESTFEKALELARINLRADDPQLAAILSNLGASKLTDRNYYEAAQLFRQALPILEGKDSRERATVYSNLCQCLLSEDRLGEAEQSCRRSVALGEKQFGPDSPSLAPPLNNLAMVLKREKRYEEAGKLFQRAISNLEKAPVTDASRLAIIKKNYAELQNNRNP